MNDKIKNKLVIERKKYTFKKNIRFYIAFFFVFGYHFNAVCYDNSVG